jgi:hypothetical protein
MSRINFAIIPVIFIIILAVFSFLSPKLFTPKAANNTEALSEMVSKRFTSLGNSIAHATFVVDAVVVSDDAPLGEIISKVRQDEPEISAIHFTDTKGVVIASSDPNLVGKNYLSDILKSGTSVVRNAAGVFEGGFSINIGSKSIGALYFKAKPVIPEVKVSSAPSPIPLILGVVLALLSFLIIMSMGKNLESKMVEHINQRQEEVFKPKIESLKNEQHEVQKVLDDLTKKTNETRQNLQKMTEEYSARKKEIEANPVVQSIEKLKANEAELLKRLSALKDEESKLTKDISLSIQNRDEVHSALEAEKKEESALREKLDLIKKKILHLETSAK